MPPWLWHQKDLEQRDQRQGGRELCRGQGWSLPRGRGLKSRRGRSLQSSKAQATNSMWKGLAFLGLVFSHLFQGEKYKHPARRPSQR